MTKKSIILSMILFILNLIKSIFVFTNIIKFFQNTQNTKMKMKRLLYLISIMVLTCYAIDGYERELQLQ